MGGYWFLNNYAEQIKCTFSINMLKNDQISKKNEIVEIHVSVLY